MHSSFQKYSNIMYKSRFTTSYMYCFFLLYIQNKQTHIMQLHIWRYIHTHTYTHHSHACDAFYLPDPTNKKDWEKDGHEKTELFHICSCKDNCKAESTHMKVCKSLHILKGRAMYRLNSRLVNWNTVQIRLN